MTEGEFYQPELWQLTDQPQNRYARSNMDPTGEYGRPQDNGDDNGQSNEEERQQQEREEAQRRTEAPIRLVDINQITDPYLKTLAERANALSQKKQQNQPLDEEYLHFLTRQLNEAKPPDDANFDQQWIYQRQKQEIGATISKLQRTDVTTENLSLEQLIEAFKPVLQSKNPREAIDRFISERFKSNDQRFGQIIAILADMALKPEEFNFEIPNLPGERYTSRSLAEYILELGVERVIGEGDVSLETVNAPYPQLNLYQQTNVDTILDAARGYDERMIREHAKDYDSTKGIYQYLTRLRVSRQGTHEVFRQIRGGNKDQFKNGVAQYLSSDGLAFSENIDGVAKVQRIYEKFYANMLAGHKGWPSVDDYKDVDQKVEKYVQELGLEGTDRYGNKVKLQEWQVRRATREAMRMTGLSERRIVYTILGEVPNRAVASDWLKSVEGEYLARTLAPVKMIPERFMAWKGAQHFVDKIKRNFRTQQKDPAYYGLALSEDQLPGKNNKEHTELGLYGQDAGSLAILDTGNYDIKTSGWRGDALFTRQQELTTEVLNGRAVTIGDFLDYHWKAANAAHAHDSKAAQKMFDDTVREAIKNQRFSLAILMRFSGVANSPELKKILWQNAANFIPSRIAAMLPGHTIAVMLQKQNIIDEKTMNDVLHTAESTGKQPQEILTDILRERKMDTAVIDKARERWEEIALKLFTAEEARVENDYTLLRNDVPQEKKEGLALRELDAYLDNLTPEERDIVHAIQKIGSTRAELFAKMKFPFVAFLDDTPKTDWGNSTGADLIRAFGDNDSIEKGLGSITALVSAPVQRPEKVIEVFHSAYEGMNSPMGPDAQQKMAVFIEAYLELVKSNAPAKYFGALMQTLRIPRSEIEEENLSADLAFDEKGIASILRALAQHEVIGDEPPHGGSSRDTMYMRLRRELGADQLEILKMYVRLLLMILGPVVAIQFLKAVLPGDLAKALG